MVSVDPSSNGVVTLSDTPAVQGGGAGAPAPLQQDSGAHRNAGHKTLLRSDALYQVPNVCTYASPSIILQRSSTSIFYSRVCSRLVTGVIISISAISTVN
jgi:hypothetical protein